MKSLFHRSWKTQMKQVNQDLHCKTVWWGGTSILATSFTITTTSPKRQPQSLPDPWVPRNKFQPNHNGVQPSTSTLPEILLLRRIGTLFWPMSAVSVLDIWGHIVSILATLGWVFCTFSPSAFLDLDGSSTSSFCPIWCMRGINASPQLDVH